MERALPRSMMPLRHLSRGLFIELVRRKDFFVLLIFMGVFALVSLSALALGVENPSTGTFLLNLGLSLAAFSAHLLTLMLAARQVPAELENRTIYPLLARPLDRAMYLVGKWLACTHCGVLVFLALFILGWAPVPKTESYRAGLLVQALLLQFASLGLVSALAITGSLYISKGLNLVLCGLLIFIGHQVTGLINNQASGGALEGVIAWLTRYLPDFSKLNLVTRYTDGLPALSAGSFTGLLLYAGIFIAFLLGLGTWHFRRRAL